MMQRTVILALGGALLSAAAVAQVGEHRVLPPDPDLTGDAFERKLELHRRAGRWRSIARGVQEHLDRSAGRTMRRERGLHHPAARVLEHSLLSCGPEALAAYREQQDPIARDLLRRAIEDRDERLLEDLVERRFLTSSGDQAALRLARLRMDEGRLDEALGLLRRIDDHPAPDVDRRDALLRRAICCRLTGRLEELAGCRERLGPIDRPVDLAPPAPAPPPTGPPVVRLRIAWIDRLAPDDHDGLFTRMQADLAEFADEHLESAARLEAGLDRRRWDDDEDIARLIRSHRQAAENLQGTRVWYAARRRPFPPAIEGTVAGSRLLVPGPAGAIVLEPATGERIGSGPGARPPGPTTVRLASGDVVTADGSLSAWHLHDDRVAGRIAGDGSLTYRIEGDEPPWRVGPPGPGNRLVVEHASLGPLAIARPPAGGRFLGPPILGRRSLLLPARIGDAHEVIALSRRLEILWRTEVGRPAPDRDPATVGRQLLLPPEGMPLGADRDRVYAVGDGGHLVALDATTGRRLWIHSYLRTGPRPVGRIVAASWLTSPPLTVADSLVVAPVDSDRLLVVEAATGRERWTAERGENYLLLDAVGDRVIVGGQAIVGHSLADGSIAWQVPGHRPLGRGLRAAGRLVLPVRTPAGDGLLVVDPTDGTVDRFLGLPPGEDVALGNLVRVGSLFVSVGRDVVAFETGPEDGAIETLAEEDRVRALVERAEGLLVDGRIDEALADLTAAHELLGADRPLVAEGVARRIVAACLDLSRATGRAEPLERAARFATTEADRLPWQAHLLSAEPADLDAILADHDRRLADGLPPWLADAWSEALATALARRLERQPAFAARIEIVCRRLLDEEDDRRVVDRHLLLPGRRSPEVELRVARAYRALGRRDEAIALLRSLADAVGDPGSPTERCAGQATDLLLEVYLED